MKPEDSHEWLEHLFRQLPEPPPEPPPFDVVPPSTDEIRAYLDSGSFGAQLVEGGHIITGPDGTPIGVAPVTRTDTEPPVLHWKDRERFEQALRDHLNNDQGDQDDD